MTVNVTRPARSLTVIPGSIALLGALALLAGCGGSSSQKSGGGRRGASGPPEVGYVVVQPTSVPITTELPGAPPPSDAPRSGRRSRAYPRAACSPKARSSAQGQTLYQIDPSLYRAAAAQAQANLASAAGHAEAAADQGRALQAARRHRGGQPAGLYRRRGRRRARPPPRSRRTAPRSRPRGSTCASPACRRRSPAGSAARWSPTGALVTAGQADPLADDPAARSDLSSTSSSRAPSCSRCAASSPAAGAAPASAAVRLKLEDGSDYGLTGTRRVRRGGGRSRAPAR